MSVYFTHFNKIYYDDFLSIDITKRTKFVETNLGDPFLFLPYTIREDDRPEDISLYYYGSMDHTWLVLLANKMFNPYTDWVMNDKQFEDYLIAKYASLSGKEGGEVIHWLQDQTIFHNILWFEKDDILISPQTLLIELAFDNVRTLDLQSDIGMQLLYETGVDQTYTPIRIYDYEVKLNEDKRQIVLVDKKYLTQVEQEFKKLIRQ